jgi:hypothetical protein
MTEFMPENGDPYDALVNFWKDQLRARDPAMNPNYPAGIVGDDWAEDLAAASAIDQEKQAEAFWQAKAELGITEE